jgi:hypothetical protein
MYGSKDCSHACDTQLHRGYMVSMLCRLLHWAEVRRLVKAQTLAASQYSARRLLAASVWL